MFVQARVIPNVFEAEDLRQRWRQELGRWSSISGVQRLERELEQIGRDAYSPENELWSQGWIPVRSSLQFDPATAWSVTGELLEAVNTYEIRSAALNDSGLLVQTTTLRDDLHTFQVRLSTLSDFGEWDSVNTVLEVPAPFPVRPRIARAELYWFEAQTLFLGAMVAVRERDEFWVSISEVLLRACATTADESDESPARGLEAISARSSAERALPRETRAGPTGQNSDTDAEDPHPGIQSRLEVGR